MKLIFKITDYCPDTNMIDVKVCRHNSHKSIDDHSGCVVELDRLDLTDFESFSFSLLQKLNGFLERSYEQQSILEENKPDENASELDFTRMVGKIYQGEFRDKSTRLLRMKKIIL